MELLPIIFSGNYPKKNLNVEFHPMENNNKEK